MTIESLEGIGRAIAKQVEAALAEFADELGADAAQIKASAARIAHTATLIVIGKASGQDVQRAERALVSAWSSLRTRVSVIVARQIRQTIERGLRRTISAVILLLSVDR